MNYNSTIYVLSCDTVDKKGGIYAFDLTNDGKLKKKDYLPCDRPMYAVKCSKGLGVLLRAPYDRINFSGYFYVDEKLKNSTNIKSTQGLVACHLCVDGEELYSANYSSGSISKNDTLLEIRHGSGPNAARQASPHAHFVGITPDGYLAVCDLGTDTLAIYNKELSLVSEEKVPAGYGVRHLVFSNDGKYIYAINELVPAISIFSYEFGKPTYIDSFRFNCKNKNANGAAIRLSDDGKTLYVSLREENVICILSVDNEKLTLLNTIDCGGNAPRDFNIFGKYLICCNQLSNDLSIIDLTSNELKAEIVYNDISTPLCVL